MKTPYQPYQPYSNQYSTTSKLKRELQSQVCTNDYGYNPEFEYGELESGLVDDWSGIDCNSPGKKITKKHCIYNKSSTNKNNSNNSNNLYANLDATNMIDKKLECAYTKWNWEDKSKDVNPKKKVLERKRKKTMEAIIRGVCKKNNILCSEKDFDGLPKNKDYRCLNTKSCDDSFPSLKNLIKDMYEFYKDISTFPNLKLTDKHYEKIVGKNTGDSLTSKIIQKAKNFNSKINNKSAKIANKTVTQSNKLVKQFNNRINRIKSKTSKKTKPDTGKNKTKKQKNTKATPTPTPTPNATGKIDKLKEQMMKKRSYRRKKTKKPKPKPKPKP